jgi:polar amino acid transport system substrate-binding protein
MQNHSDRKNKASHAGRYGRAIVRHALHFWCGACLLLFSSTLSAIAVEKPILRAVTAGENFPYIFFEDDHIQGLGFDVANTLAERAGFTLNVVALPWTRALQTAKNEPAVMIFSLGRIPEREDSFYWIGPIAKIEVWLYKLKSRKDVSVKNLTDVRRYLVGDARSSASLVFLTENGINVDTAPSDLSNCRKFKIGRVDLIPFAPLGLATFADSCNIPLDQIEKTVRLVDAIDLYIGVGKNTDSALFTRLNTEFNLMVQDKTLQKISKRWSVETSAKVKH